VLEKLVELCTSNSSLYWLVLGSDLSIAAAYFAIPITMAVVLRDRKDDIPYPWLWVLFVTFIVACGLTHAAHVWSAVSGTQYLGLHAGIGVFCGIVSVGTAIAFLFIIPEIKRLPSPKQQQAKLEYLVAQRTAEKDRLILEINHRVGNQLQIVRSMVSVHRRRAHSQDTIEVLQQLTVELDKMAAEHIRHSQTDYLRHGVNVDGFSNSADAVPASVTP
jgi:histidine kinase